MVTKRTVAIKILSLVVAFAIAPASAQNPPPSMVLPDRHCLGGSHCRHSDLRREDEARSSRSSSQTIAGVASSHSIGRQRQERLIVGSRIALRYSVTSQDRGFGPHGNHATKSFSARARIPAPWASYDGENPCGDGFSNEVVTLSSFTAFGDFNQAILSLDKLGNPLVAQTKEYTRYEVRVNQPEFDSIVGHKWYLASNLPTKDAACSLQ